MQTAVDCNGSSSNTTTISTTITTTTTVEPNDKDNNKETMTQHHLHHPTTITTTTHHHQQLRQPNPETEQPTTVLRHRVTANTNNAATTPNYGAIIAPKNGLTHLIDAAEYLGSNVECMSVTPSPSPQASPSKQASKVKVETLSSTSADADTVDDASAGVSTCIPLALQDTYKTNTSSESPTSSASKTASNSTSTTSSVIATPILKRNGNVFKDTQEQEEQEDNITKPETTKDGKEETRNGDGGEEENSVKDFHEGIAVAAEDACKPFRECTNKQQQQLLTTTTNQMLPNTSSTIIKKELSSSSLLPMSSSSTTSLSISTPAPPASSTSSLEPPPLLTLPSSPSSSSSSSSSTSVTPASATNTPALISTSPSSSSSSSSTSAAQLKLQGLSISGLVEAELLQWQDMPQYLQFNPYVLKGYRPLQTFKGCLLSLFYWHNETINILTHALPIVYILAIIPGLMPWDRGYRFLSFCHVFGSVAPWCGSFVYHLFMNIERGENVYYRLLKLDMVGIWVSQSFGALPLVTATTFCFTFKWKWFIIITYCLVSLWGLYKALTASSPWQRRLCFALPFTMRSILTFFRTIGLVGGNRVALEHVYLQDVVSILGGAIGAMRIPEKWFPGLVDFYLNSHNIMHVLVVVAVYSMHKATMKDFEWMDNANCDVFVNITSKVLESTLNTKIEL